MILTRIDPEHEMYCSNKPAKAEIIAPRGLMPRPNPNGSKEERYQWMRLRQAEKQKRIRV